LETDKMVTRQFGNR